MSEAKRLLSEATPLPWRWDVDEDNFYGWTGEDAPPVTFDEDEPDRELVLYAVNRLPDYEAAVDLLRRWRDGSLDGDASTLGDLTDETTDLLARLREKVTA